MIVTGRLKTRVYIPTDGPLAGKKTSVTEVVVEEIGPSLRWTTTEVATKTAPDSRVRAFLWGGPDSIRLLADQRETLKMANGDKSRPVIIDNLEKSEEV